MEVSGKKYKSADVLCDLCLLLGKNTKPEHFCADCNEFFCDNCCMVHKVGRYTRNHKLLDSGNMPKQKLESYEDSVCSKHSRKGLEYICEDHNSIFCSVCVTLDHKNCNLLFIDDIATDFEKTPQYKSLIDSIASLTKQLQEIKDMSIKKGEKLQKSHGKFIRDVKAFRKEINQILDTIEGTIIKEADDLKDDHLKLAVSDTAMCDNILAKLNIASEKMREQLRYMQHRQLVISAKETQIKCKEYDAKLVELAQGESMELEFVRNENLLRSLRSFTTIGDIKKMDGDPDPAEIPPRSQSSRSQDSGPDVPNQSGASPHPSHFSQMNSEIGGGTFYQNVPNPGQDFTHAHQGFNTPGQGQAQQPIPQMFPFPLQMFQPYQQPGDGQNFQQQLQQQIDPRAFQEFLQQFQMQQGQPYGQAFPGQSEGTNPTDPPPPYTSGGEQMMAGSITELKGPIGGGQAVADQEEGFRRLNEKAEREKQTRNENYPKNDGNDDEDDGCQNSKCQTTKLVVKDLPTSVQEDLIELYFEKLGKDEVVRIEMDEDQRMALVEFKEPEAVERVLNGIPVKIRNTELRVRPFYEEKEEEVALCTVEVHGLNGIDASTVEMYFENTKRSGGDDIGEIDYDEEEGRALITYKSEEIARRVADKGNHILSKQPLEVTLWQPLPKKSWNVSTPEPEPEPEFEPADTIEVRGIDESIDKETLEMYFESKKRSGGDEIQRIEIQGTAVYITYTSEEVAQRVVDKGDHYLNRLRLDVTLFRQLKQPGRSRERSVTPEPVRTIEVLGIDESIDEATLEMYFENTKRSGGGEIETVDADYEEGIAYITFAEEEVAERVISKERHILNKKPLQVQLSTQTSMCEEIGPPEPLCTVEVQGITPSIDQETLEMYFENSKRSGGGDISYVDIDKDERIAHITFNEEEVAQRVVERGKHVLNRIVLKVAIYQPQGQTQKSAKGSNAEGSESNLGSMDEKQGPTSVVKVKGVKRVTSTETMLYYFENKRRSDGGEIKQSEKHEEDDDIFFITFSEPEVAKKVADRKHVIEGTQLEVSLHIPPKPRPYYEDKVLIRGLRSTTTKDCLFNFLEAKSGSVPLELLRGEKEGVVLITFESQPDVSKLVEVCNRYPLEGGKLEVSQVQVTNCIIVLHLPENVTKDTVWFYFENKRRSDGGPIDKVLLKEDECTCLVYFEDYKVVDRVIRKTHKIGEQVLTVNVYLECLGCPQGDDTEKTKETSTTLKLIETKMLLAEKYPNKMESKYPGLKVKINQNKNEIVFDGLLGDIKNAKLDMFNYKENFAIGSVEMENCRLKFSLYENKPVKDYIVKKLKSSQVTAVWQVKDQTLQVCCGEAEKLGKAVTIVKESIVEHNVTLSKENVVVVESESWESMLHEQNQKYPGRIAVDTSGKMAYVCGTDDIADEFLEVLKKFLRTNTIIEDHVDFTKSMNRLIEKNHKQDIERISKKYASLNTQIVTKVNNAGFTLLGTAEGLEQVKKEMNSIKLKIITKTHTLESPGIAGHMESKGHEHMNTVEKSYPVVFDNPEEGDSDREYEVQVLMECTAYDDRKIYTAEGDMTELSVDVLVNAADSKLSMTGGVGKAIISKGGKEIERACRDYIQDEGELGEGEAFTTTAGNLKAKYIVHIVGPVWRSGHNNEESLLAETVLKSMKQATVKNVKSIALPAISCGVYGFPARRATKVIVQSVKNFFREMQDSSITEVYLCDVKSNTVKGFAEALEMEFGKRNMRIVDHSRQNLAAARPKRPKIVQKRSKKTSMPTNFHSAGGSSDESDGPQTLPLPMKGVRIGNITLMVITGEIGKQSVDVIVNTTARNLDLKNGAVSQSLLRAAGTKLQQEVSNKYPNGIKDGEIAVTSGQALKCRCIIHTSLMNWDGKNAEAKNALHTLMNNCLNEADTNNYNSIAFPAIGTGNLGFPRDVVAKEMFTVISNFAKKNPRSNITDVKFIVYEKDTGTISAFNAEEKRWKDRRESRQFQLNPQFANFKVGHQDSESDSEETEWY